MNDWDEVASMYDAYVPADYDLAFWRQMTRDIRGEVLELMAGTGRVSLPLLLDGVRLTCVDSSGAMLRELQRKADDANTVVRTYERSVCDLPFTDEFELAFIAFQSFSELPTPADQRSALAAMFNSLVPGGTAVITLHEPGHRRGQVDGVLRLVGLHPYCDGLLSVTAAEEWDCEGGTVRRVQYFKHYDADGCFQSERLHRLQFRLPSLSDVRVLAEECGFSIEAIWGDYSRSVFEPESSAFMILVLAKQPGQAIRLGDEHSTNAARPHSSAGGAS